jgi:hypothetical protein
MQAYSVDISEGAADMSRDVTLNGESFRLTDTEMEFLGKLVWSIENTPDRR